MKRLSPAFALLAVISLPVGAAGQEIRATAQGGVARPGTYTIQKGDRLSALIGSAGGYADDAWLPGAILDRASLGKDRKEALAELVSGAEAESLAAPEDEEPKRAFFRSLANLKPTGRMRVRLAHLRLLKGSGDDVPLEDGDILFIPTAKPPVAVAGAVRNGPSSFPHADGAEPEDYIRMAGGFSDDADTGLAYILKADSAVPIPGKGLIRWNEERSRWELTAFVDAVRRIEPGDTIVVPRKPAAGSWAREMKGLHGLLRQIAVLTGEVVETP